MSWINDNQIEVWLVLAASLALTLWYASNQLVYSLHFLYQLGRFLLPGLVPDIGAPG